MCLKVRLALLIAVFMGSSAALAASHPAAVKDKQRPVAQKTKEKPQKP